MYITKQSELQELITNYKIIKLEEYKIINGSLGILKFK